MRIGIYLAIAIAATGTTGCSSSANQGCSTKNGTVLAATAWPKFRNDLTNTGRTEIEVQRDVGDAELVFPRDGTRVGTIATTPILDDISRCSKSQDVCTRDSDCPVDEECTERNRIVVASTDSSIYILNADGVLAVQPIDTQGSITATPLLGADGTLFVASGDGVLRQYRTDGTIRRNTLIGGFLSGSPTIGNDGTIYQGSLGGVFSGACANGALKFSIGTAQVQTSAAVIPDPENEDDPKERLILFGVDTGLVRAVDRKGRERWSLSQPSAIGGAIVVDETTNRFFMAQISGRVSAGNALNGLPDEEFSFHAANPVSASMALGGDDLETPTLYVADIGGTLYAVERDTGVIRWTFEIGAPIRSSPAVSTGGERDVVVFGADDGFVYAVQDDGDEPTLVWSALVGPPIGQSSPSIAPSGAVLIGTEDVGNGGAVFLIGEL